MNSILIPGERKGSIQRDKDLVSLSQAKILGGVGSILVLLIFVPTVGWIVSIAGLVLVLIAVKYISDVVQDRSIFNNILIGLVLAIVGLVVAGVIIVGTVLSKLSTLQSLTSLTTVTTGTPSIPSGVYGIIATVIIGLAVLWILLVISSVFVRRSYNTIAQRLNISLFRTAALLYLIGAILAIVLIGFVIVLVAEILLIIAFFSISESRMGFEQTTTMPPPPPSSMQPGGGMPAGQSQYSTRTCPRCGAPIAQDALFCPSCGSNLKQ